MADKIFKDFGSTNITPKYVSELLNQAEASGSVIYILDDHEQVWKLEKITTEKASTK